jgi:hypothetical protein
MYRAPVSGAKRALRAKCVVPKPEQKPGSCAATEMAPVAENPQTRVDIQRCDEIPLTVQAGPLLLRTIAQETGYV